MIYERSESRQNDFVFRWGVQLSLYPLASFDQKSESVHLKTHEIEKKVCSIWRNIRRRQWPRQKEKCIYLSIGKWKCCHARGTLLLIVVCKQTMVWDLISSLMMAWMAWIVWIEGGNFLRRKRFSCFVCMCLDLHLRFCLLILSHKDWITYSFSYVLLDSKKIKKTTWRASKTSLSFPTKLGYLLSR